MQRDKLGWPDLYNNRVGPGGVRKLENPMLSDVLGLQRNEYALRAAEWIESLCRRAQEIGPDIRVAVSMARIERDGNLSYSIVHDHQFLEPGAFPSLQGGSVVYGPFPSVDSTTNS